jgi:ferredoxin
MKPELALATNTIRLSQHALLRADPDACLSIRYRDLDCEECVRVCPTDALSVGESAFALSDACTGCGRCTARCPTGALAPMIRDADLPDDAPQGLRVECSKVPTRFTDARTLRLPCTGTLSVSQWLRLVRIAGSAGIELIDRSWCEGCDSGGERCPAGRNINEANELLAEVGWPEARRIRITQAPLPEQLRPNEITDLEAERPVSRRGFLRRLAGEAAEAGSRLAIGNSTEPISLPNGRRRIVPSARLAVLAQLKGLAEDCETVLPSRLFRTVTVSDACQAHHVCARSCPTTALRAFADGEAAGLGFDPMLCIDCGLCARNCPEGAISMDPATDPASQAQARTLATHRRRTCLDCGSHYVPPRDTPDTEVCPACAKSQELGRSLFADLFRA